MPCTLPTESASELVQGCGHDAGDEHEAVHHLRVPNDATEELLGVGVPARAPRIQGSPPSAQLPWASRPTAAEQQAPPSLWYAQTAREPAQVDWSHARSQKTGHSQAARN